MTVAKTVMRTTPVFVILGTFEVKSDDSYRDGGIKSGNNYEDGHPEGPMLTLLKIERWWRHIKN